MSSKESKKVLLQRRLQHWENLYDKLRDSLRKTGYICPGSVARRFMPCGKSYCRCMKDPSKLHGPYYEWTRKWRGKTIAVRLTADQAGLYQQWIENRRGLRTVIAQMHQISTRIAKLKCTL